MKRELKVKGWDEELKKMLPPIDLSGPLSTYDWLGKKDVLLLEFTGLKDKNGKEIYEGDNLQWLQNGNTTTGSVKFAGGSFYVENFYFASQDNPCDCFGEDAEFKVIGNIHEPLKDK